MDGMMMDTEQVHGGGNNRDDKPEPYLLSIRHRTNGTELEEGREPVTRRFQSARKRDTKLG